MCKGGLDLIGFFLFSSAKVRKLYNINGVIAVGKTNIPKNNPKIPKFRVLTTGISDECVLFLPIHRTLGIPKHHRPASGFISFF